MPRRIILASGSPRRKAILSKLIGEFDVIPAEFAEEHLQDTGPSDVAIGNALGKARYVSALHPDAMVIGADTVVVLDNAILGKPHSKEDAADMLGSLSNRTHQVITGIAVVCIELGIEKVDSESTKVRFRQLPKKVIMDYVSTGSCMDKAGAYGIQDVGDEFIFSVMGDRDNVIGLPLGLLRRMLDDIDKKV